MGCLKPKRRYRNCLLKVSLLLGLSVDLIFRSVPIIVIAERVSVRQLLRVVFLRYAYVRAVTIKNVN